MIYVDQNYISTLNTDGRVNNAFISDPEQLAAAAADEQTTTLTAAAAAAYAAATASIDGASAAAAARATTVDGELAAASSKNFANNRIRRDEILSIVRSASGTGGGFQDVHNANSTTSTNLLSTNTIYIETRAIGGTSAAASLELPNNKNSKLATTLPLLGRPRVYIPLIVISSLIVCALLAGAIYLFVYKATSASYGNHHSGDNFLVDSSSSSANSQLDNTKASAAAAAAAAEAPTSPLTNMLPLASYSSPPLREETGDYDYDILTLTTPTAPPTSTATTTTTTFNQETTLKTLTNIINNANCGKSRIQPNLQQTRIMHGFEARRDSWPWVVSLGYVGSRTSLPHACGGSLINNRFVITATHCVVEASIFGLVGRPIPGSDLFGSLSRMMRVYVGVTTRSSDITPSRTFRAVRIISHPGFDPSTFKNDLTLIELDRDVEMSDSVNTICLSPNTVLNPGTFVYAIGWGFTDGNFFKAANTLMQVKFPIKDAAQCGLVFIPHIQFCAGDPSKGKDTCNGDSGGPIMEYKNDAWQLTGIVSNGDSACTGKGIYTNVAAFITWISNNAVVTKSTT